MHYKKIFRLFLLAGFIVLGCSVVFRATRKPSRSDFSVFITAAQAVKNGADPYRADHPRDWKYVYFPLLAILLVPIAGFSMEVTSAIWYLLSLAAFFGTIFVSAKLSSNPREGLLSAVMAAVLSIPVFFDTFTRGQVGMLILFLSL